MTLRRRASRRADVVVTLCCLFALSSGCASNGSESYEPTAISDFPVERFGMPASAQPLRFVGPLPLHGVGQLASILAVRSNLASGAIEFVTTVDGIEFSRRRIERIGANLSILPVPVCRTASIEIFQVANSGALDVVFGSAALEPVTSERASTRAAERAAQFEAETGKLADPVVENLVPNASFAADDEVRGTPADWFAYVETSTNVLERRLRVSGIAPGRRPYLATGPIRVEPGRRYRVLVRATVSEGAAAVRIADYEELRVIADLGVLRAGDGSVERTIDFTASDADRAARIRFEPVTAGERAAFEISAIQMELLPW